MKRIKHSYITLIIIIITVISCKNETHEFGEIITPSNIEITYEIVGKDASNPNGDGSGTVHFSAQADNTLSFSYVYNGESSHALNGDYTYNFSTLGLNTHTVTVVAFGTGGITTSKTVQLDVLATYAPPADLLEKLYGNGSKTWRIKSEVNGHFGLGPVGGITFGEWFSAGAEEKSEVGMYDDRMTFNEDGTYVHTTGGTIFGRSGLIDELSNSGGSGGEAEGDDIINYNFGDYTENWSLTAPGGQETLTLSGIGFIGYYVANHVFTIVDRSVPNELTLKITDANNGFDWWFLLTSEEKGVVTPPPTVDYVYDTLVWEDDFNTDGAPDPSKWTYDIGTGTNGWGNFESQYYTDRADNVKVEGGHLIITAKKEDFSGSAYTSARIKTQDLYEFQYGRVDVRAQLPEAQGTWPAFWMLGANFPDVGWPHCGEIDIMEQRGDDKNTVLGTLHWFDGNTNALYGSETSISNVASEFHTYTVEWTAEFIRIYVDDVQYHEMANTNTLPFNADFFLIFNIAMGGTLGGTVDAAFAEDMMIVDYVKVYQ